MYIKAEIDKANKKHPFSEQCPSYYTLSVQNRKDETLIGTVLSNLYIKL